MGYYSHLFELNDNSSHCFPFFPLLQLLLGWKRLLLERTVVQAPRSPDKVSRDSIFPPDPFTDINDEAALSVSLPWLAMP